MFFGIFISVGLLWILLLIYSPTTDANQSRIETWSVVLAMQILRIIGGFVLIPFIGPLFIFVEVVALYFLVTKICDLDRSRTLRICFWYLGILFLLGLFMQILAT